MRPRASRIFATLLAASHSLPLGLAQIVAEPGKQESPAIETDSFLPSAKRLRLNEADQRALKIAIHKFLSAQSVSDQANFVRFPERVRPLMEKFYATNPFLKGGVHVEPKMRLVNGLIFTTVTITGEERPRILALEKAGGEFLADWEAFVLHSSAPWQELKSRHQQTKATLRGVLKLPNPNDDTAVDSVRIYPLIHPLSGETIFLQAKGSVSAETLAILQDFTIGAKEIPVTAFIEYEGDSPRLAGLRRGWLGEGDR